MKFRSLQRMVVDIFLDPVVRTTRALSRPSSTPNKHFCVLLHCTRVPLVLSVVVWLLPPCPLNAQSDPIALKKEAARHLNAGRYGEAITILNQVIVQKPSDADAYHLRALCYQSRGQMENSVQDFRKAASLDPGNKQMKNDLANAVERLRGKVQEQIEGYKRELAKNVNAPGPYLEIAKAYASLDEKAQAERWYDEYLKRAEATPEEILRYCELLAAGNQLKKGETVLQQYSQKYPQDADISSKYGYFLLWLGKFQPSQQAFERALALNPALAEAQEGIEQARAREHSSRSGTAPRRDVRGQPIPENPIDRYGKLLRFNPRDEEARFSLAGTLILGNRFDEASSQLDTLARGSADSLRILDLRNTLLAVRDSVIRAKIAECLVMLTDDPGNRQMMLRLGGYHAQLAEYDEALSLLERYLEGVPDTSAQEVRFRYAQYAAWGKSYDKALAKLSPLLKRSPGNLEYQLLRGQIAVWAVQDVDQGVRCLNNVIRLSPTNLVALLTMSSAQALQRNFVAAKEYLNRARRLDPLGKELRAAEAFYEDALRADAQREVYALIESARRLAASGECTKAVKKYEEFLSRVPDAQKSIFLEYADAQSCANNHRRAIEIYDQLLVQGYDHDVALLRAKNLLWSGDSLEALRELKRLAAEKPGEFQALLYLGEAYERTGQIPEAREVFEDLLQRSTTPDERQLVRGRLQYLPEGGFSGALASFPTRLAVSPPITYYYDNQQFSMSSYGARFEMEVGNTAAVGGYFLRSQLGFLATSRLYSALKGQLFFSFTDQFRASGSLGILTSPGRRNKTIGDANLEYDKPGVLHVAASMEASDAALLLYTPYLINLDYYALVYRVQGSYLSSSRWKFAGSFRVISVSDGNAGSELQLRVARTFFDELFAGYEYVTMDFIRQAPFIPFTNHSRQLYYTPQNLESHSLWVEWQSQKDQEVMLILGGKVGYIPSYHSSLREINGTLEYHATSRFLLRGVISAGNTHRNEWGYSYLSTGLSFYWSFL